MLYLPSLRASKTRPLRALLLILLALFGVSPAFSQTLANRFEQPKKQGVYVVDLKTGKLLSVGGFYDWKASPDGRFIVAGTETDGTSGIYQVSVVNLGNNSRRFLMRFTNIQPPFGAGFRWTPDSRRVAIVTDRDDDGRDETQTFDVVAKDAKSAPRVAAKPQRRLLASTAKKLRQRFSDVGEITFSHDGKWVAASCSKGSFDKPNYVGGIWVFRPDGSGLKQVTRNVSMRQSEFQDREVQWLAGTYRLAFRRTFYEDEGI